MGVLLFAQLKINVSDPVDPYIVEAKGPGATLSKTKTMGDQMSWEWIDKNAQKLLNQNQDLASSIINARRPHTSDTVVRVVYEAVEENNGIIIDAIRVPAPNY